jgi:peptidoglycan hydrolase-like protein with peptidoglycan-binding domain
MLLKIGSTGRAVKEIQTLLDAHGFWVYHKFTEYFGGVTDTAVRNFQKAKGIKDDGEVGPTTYRYLLMGVDTDRGGKDVAKVPTNDTDNKLDMRGSYTTTNGLVIDMAYLDSDEYVRDYGKIKPKNLFIHHTAGWDNPYNVIHSWNVDKRGRVATQYVIGGLNTNNNSKYDGTVVECFPDNYIGWHLGKVGGFDASKYSVGIEMNNFGYVTKKDGKYYTYVDTLVPDDQVCDLGYKFRGHQYWHKYSDAQIESLRLLILHIKEIYPTINIYNGLIEDLNTKTPAEAFEFNKDAYNAKKFGMWTHTNVRSDKFDCHPDQRLVTMLKSL